ncbi:MAG: aprataxin-like protein [Chaenotheca gracillima]|nr:MAG: aprataxin-like protein [Chaenotheca gracillima]
MGEANVVQALEKINSERLKDRIEGLADLRHIFQQNRRNVALHKVNDKAYHKICEGLFRATSIEKATLSKASSATAKSQSSTRLSSCAATLRVVVEVGVSRLRKKTVKAFLDHIIQVLPSPHDGLCEPLSLDYLKSLRSVLQFQAHVEHLSVEDWQAAVDFCVDSIRIDDDLSSARSFSNGARISSMRSNGGTRGSTPSKGLDSPLSLRVNTGFGQQTKGSVEELILCLEQLFTAPNAPILDRAQTVLGALIRFLETSPTLGRSHQSAFATINLILPRIITDSIPLSKQVVAELMPLLKTFWNTKITSVKDEILVTLIHSQTYIEAMLLKDDAEKFSSDVESLVDVLQEEYGRRLERDQLQLDDIELRAQHKALSCDGPLSFRSFGLRNASPKAEQAWAMLNSVAVLGSFLHERASKSPQGKSDDIGPNKRRRVAQRFEDLARQTSLPHLSIRLCSLQTITFLLEKMTLDVEQMKALLEQLLQCVSDGNGVIISWSMIAMTRAACHLLEAILALRMVDIALISESVEAMISSFDISGPAVLVDSSLSFWTCVLGTRSVENPSSASAISDKVLQWFASKWHPSRTGERHLMSQYASHVTPQAILEMLSTCSGGSIHIESSGPIFSYGLTTAATIEHQRNSELLRYLLLLKEIQQMSFSHASSLEVGVESPLGNNAQFVKEKVIYDICKNELIQAKEIWSSMISVPSQPFSIDALRVLVSLCCIGATIAAQLQALRSLQKEDLWRSVDDVLAVLKEALVREATDQSCVDAALEVVSSLLPSQIDVGKTYESRSAAAVTRIAGTILTALGMRNSNYHNNTRQEDDSDIMDIDTNMSSQESQRRSDTTRLPRRRVLFEGNMASIRTTIILRLHQLMALAVGYDIDDEIKENCSTLQTYILSLRGEELLTTQKFLRDDSLYLLFANRTDAYDLLVHLGEQLLQDYDFERCEVSMSIYLGALQGFASLFSQTDISDDLSDMSAQIYSWFIEVVMEKKISSSSVQLDIAYLLKSLFELQPEYPKSISLPSIRTSILKLLENGEASVKFEITKIIPDMFQSFTLDQHETILEDVVISLPSDADWEAGIALRLLTLARLASRWYTLLRRCVYYIFETPDPIPEAGAYAKRCLLQLSRAMNLEGPRELLKLFLSQILHTWLENHPLQSIPFASFDYDTLEAFLQDIRVEAAAQLLMRNEDEQLSKLAHLLGQPEKDLILASSGKVLAYSIARDISVPPAKNDVSYVSCEMRVRNILGKDMFSQSFQSNFVNILSILFRTMENEDQIERAFSKVGSMKFALKALHSIKGFGSSQAGLPPPQQPSFRARYLIDEIAHLCHRTGHNIAEIWSPPLVVFVARSLFDSIHPALGALHACSVIRRLRILVCVAGDTALGNYPLEMLLHRLRPWLTEFHCAEDAMGLFRYLLEAGKPYLCQVPSFLTGLALSTLVSLRSFVESVKESTTQEKDHQATVSHGRAFHSWLSAFLDSYTSPLLSESEELCFRAIISSASGFELRGNAIPGTTESAMLQVLLREENNPKSLLSYASRTMAFSSLYTDFKVPETFRDDIFASDEEASANVPALWKSCHRADVKKAYLVWVARVLGRAYASTGQIQTKMITETSLDDMRAVSKEDFDLAFGSKTAILQSLLDLLHSDVAQEITLAESALQLVLVKSVDETEAHFFEHVIPESFRVTLEWENLQMPGVELVKPNKIPLEDIQSHLVGLKKEEWVQSLSICLCYATGQDTMLQVLPPLLASVPNLAEHLLPFILHIICFEAIQHRPELRATISDAMRHWFQACEDSTVPHVKVLINAVLYLRTQELPNEITRTERERWLDLDFGQLAIAASKCKMYKTALLFIEIQASHSSDGSRRSSKAKFTEPTKLLSEIFRSIDEPDAFYGVQQEYSLRSIMDNLDYEKAGYKSLSFEGAHFDSQLRQNDSKSSDAATKLVMSLEDLGLSGLSYSLLQNHSAVQGGSGSVDRFYQSARRLEQWDLPAPLNDQSSQATLYRAFQSLNNMSSRDSIRAKINDEMEVIMKTLIDKSQTGSSLQSSMRTLAILNEVDEVLTSKTVEDIQECWDRMLSRQQWMHTGKFEDVSQIMSARETLFSSLAGRPHLRDLFQSTKQDTRLIEVQSLLESSRMSRVHEALQFSLNTTTFLSQLIEPCREMGLEISAAANYEAANVLWAQAEMTPSIRMLQQLSHETNLAKQAVPLGKAELLATLGHQVSEARLEKPETIISLYLVPAIKALKGNKQGNEAGKVYYEFASFCDRQLQDADNLEDFQRIKRLRERKATEVRELETMLEAAGSQGKSNLQQHRSRAKQWYDLDNREFERLRQVRQSLLVQSVENYLLSLAASDLNDNGVLRFCALWLEQPDSETASLVNASVSELLSKVPSRKFASLMNQLSSRLSDTRDEFQTILFNLVFRICVDHPYHAMHHIFMTSKTKGKDETAMSRHAAALKMVSKLRADAKASRIWIAVHNTNICYAKLALEKLDDTAKPGSKMALRKSPAGQRMEAEIARTAVPPPTMKIELRADCDYTDVPTITKFHSEMTVAGGVSVPKIVTALASDGARYKQLVKGGNDDLRQDAIMEQVFEQVSALLQKDRFTRQRNLRIRTYKVVPLPHNAGIIEFVPYTMPLHDYLMPAHQKHYPKDLKPHACRKAIGDVQTRSVEVRLKAYRQVTDRFHPVMRFFFTERFESPDEWFDKRLAYTRSTAAISILGHVLGLGDRHGHNVLLDEKTGEVVHIDLGVAFEQGRVLPIPEVVPFRLTRDIVDGMGITKTEGVFRRCCEFTLDALRKESYSITTILDVLRYDPLYSWTVSPLRVKRMQEQQNEIPDASAPEAEAANVSRQRQGDEPNEADRALTVVAKKLSKTLSVTATVNELIQQAMDEKHLAVLYCGWAAYA